jgi:hypothetical protein
VNGVALGPSTVSVAPQNQPRLLRRRRREVASGGQWRNGEVFVAASPAMRLARASQRAGAGFGAEFAFGCPRNAGRFAITLPRAPFRRYTGVSDSDKGNYAAA